MPVVNHDVCIGCGACNGVCPVGAMSLNAEGKAECDTTKCVGCGACAGTCPVGAITQ